MANVSIIKYKNMLLALLPNGMAWNKFKGSGLAILCEGMAVEFARISDRADDLVKESDPRSTLELITDWERVLALPDNCNPNPESVNERRASILAVLRTRGGQSREYFISVIDALGFQLEIEEHPPFTAGSSAGDSLTNSAEWAYTWTARSQVVKFHFTAGSGAGEALTVIRNEYVECLLNKLKPAHTRLIFAELEE